MDLTALLLRVNMVVAGEGSSNPPSPDDTARATVEMLTHTVPVEVPGIVFLSGGQPLDRACANLAALAELVRSADVSWRFRFAFTRALVAGSLAAWEGDPANAGAAEDALVRSCRQAARRCRR